MVLDGPRCRLVEVLDGEVLLDQVEVGLPAQAGGRRDEADGRARGQQVGREHAVDHPAVAQEVDALDARRAVGDTGAGEQGVDRSTALVDRGIDGCLVGQIEHDGLHAVEGDGGAIHHHDLGAGVEEQRCGGGAHTGGAADHQGALPLVAEGIEQ